MEPFYLERRHPLYCGLMKFRLELSTNEIGLGIGNKWRHMEYVAQLYNLLRCKLPKSWSWPDMDARTAIHGSSSHILNSQQQLETPEYFSKYMECTATSPRTKTLSEISTPRRLGGSKPSKPQPTPKTRGLLSQSVVSQIFKDRYRYSGRRDLLTLTTVEVLLNSLPSVPASMQLTLNTEAP
jgi:hypothetical protein